MSIYCLDFRLILWRLIWCLRSTVVVFDCQSMLKQLSVVALCHYFMQISSMNTPLFHDTDCIITDSKCTCSYHFTFILNTCTDLSWIWYAISLSTLQENEFVVNKALKKFSESFKLEYAIPDWKHRGHRVFPTGIHAWCAYLQHVCEVCCMKLVPFMASFAGAIGVGCKRSMCHSLCDNKLVFLALFLVFGISLVFY